MNVGLALRAIREELSLSQKELGKECFISQSSLSRLESGDHVPNPGTITKICESLGIPESLFYLIGLQEEDVAKNKQSVYRALHPMIKNLALQIVASE